MILEDLYSLAPQFMFTEDRATNSIYGVYKGFGMMIKANEQTNCFIFTTWARKGALSNKSTEQWFGEYTAKPENNFIRATDVTNYTIAAVIAADDSSAGTITRLTMFIYDITSFLTSNYYSNACSQCGSAIGLTIGNDSDGVRTQLCKMCTENEADEAAQNMTNQQPLINEQPQQPMFGADGFANPVQPAQPTFGANGFANPVQPAQPAFGANGFANPVQPVQPTFGANGFANPVQPAQPAFGANGFANPVQPAQPTFGANGFANPVQPMQNNVGVGMGAVGVGMMGSAGMMSTNQGSVPAGVKLSSASDSMGSIDPATAPESTGFTTAADLAALEPPTSTSAFTNSYNAPPIPNDFRADPVYSGGPVGVTPIMRNPERDNVNSNPFMGFLGAVIFALIACVIWVLFGMMGRISYIGGLAMGFCTVTGYKLLGKKFDVFGVISCIVVIALAVLGSNLFIVTTSIYQSGLEEALLSLGYDGFMDVFFNFFSLATKLDNLLVAAGESATFMSSFIRDLVIGYAFSAIGFCVVAVSAFKERNR